MNRRDGPLLLVIRRSYWLVIAAVVVTTALLGCDFVRIEERRGAFWETFLMVQVDEVDRFDSLAEMLDASDAVVVARVDDVDVSRIFQGDAPGDIIPYLRVELTVDRVLAGAVTDRVPLEFMVGGTPDQAAALAEKLQQQLPVDSAVVFLHAKRGANEGGLYRVTNSTGLWAPTTRSILDTPLREEPPQVSGLYEGELAGVVGVEDLIELLDSSAVN